VPIVTALCLSRPAPAVGRRCYQADRAPTILPTRVSRHVCVAPRRTCLEKATPSDGNDTRAQERPSTKTNALGTKTESYFSMQLGDTFGGGCTVTVGRQRNDECRAAELAALDAGRERMGINPRSTAHYWSNADLRMASSVASCSAAAVSGRTLKDTSYPSGVASVSIAAGSPAIASSRNCSSG
jgi:hypothetical protein